MSSEITSVVALHARDDLNLLDVNNISGVEILKFDHEFALMTYKGGYLYIKPYGAIVSAGVEVDQLDDVLEALGLSSKEKAAYLRENFSIRSTDKYALHFDHLDVPGLTPDIVHIVALHLAQSLALESYRERIFELRNELSTVVTRLQESGRVGIKRSDLRRYFGRSMRLRDTVTRDLFIFESPEVAWETEFLSNLDDELNAVFDFDKRIQGIHFNLQSILEDLNLLKDILQHNHSALLEWIIIILILVEVVHIFF